MSLTSGSRLGPYEIVGPLGAGGMGEVYKAKDTRLDRTVAIKVLPSHLADNPDLKQRFKREARAVSSLNHPHICTLYDVGEQDGVDFLVMEYLEGETLADRLKKGSLPFNVALRTAIQIADALDKAHRAGVVHRDFKPGNIMITKSGAKLTDFGLAKLRNTTQEEPALSDLPTEEKPLTEKGAILGTFQYMAPEQLEGKEADARADIFAFGVVLYEMLTGRKAFEGKSQASLIGAILKDEPKLVSELQPISPSALDRVVQKCLAKNPEERWHGAHDLRDVLMWIVDEGSRLEASTPSHRTGGRLVLAATAVVAALLAGFVVWSFMRAENTAAPLPARLAINLPPEQELAVNVYAAAPIALSRDGTNLVYAATNSKGSSQLYFRALGQFESFPIPGTEYGQLPFFSPDGQWVGFWANRTLQKVAVRGGAPIKICNVIFKPRGASWGPNGTIILGGVNTGLSRVSAEGGVPDVLTYPDVERGEEYHAWPDVLPDGGSVLFTVATGESSDIAVLSFESGEWNILEGSEDTAQPRYLETGHLVYVRKGSLLAVPFDPARQQPSRSAVPVLDGVHMGWDAGLDIGYFSMSQTGSLVYVTGGAAPTQDTLVLVDRQGQEKLLTEQQGLYSGPRFSPDGRRLAVSNRSELGHVDIWVYDLERTTHTRLTFEESNVDPIWTPDGTRVTFPSFRSGSFNVYWMPADGSGEAELLLMRPYGLYSTSWSPNSELLALVEENPETEYDIWVLTLGNEAPSPFLASPFSETSPVFSPDGQRLAYVSDESGRPEVYVRPFPGPGKQWTVSTNGGTEPAWSPDGRELFYRQGNTLMVAEIKREPTFTFGTPRQLLEGRWERPTGVARVYDVSPDGSHFVAVKANRQAITEMNVVLDWSEELKRLVPVN